MLHRVELCRGTMDQGDSSEVCLRSFLCTNLHKEASWRTAEFFLLAFLPASGETVYEGGGQSDWSRVRETVRGGEGGGSILSGNL